MSSGLNNAKRAIESTKEIIAEARNYPGCEALVAMLSQRIVTYKADVAYRQESEERLEAARRAFDAAKREEEAADRAVHGTADRDEALRLRDDLYAAGSCLTLRKHELKRAEAEVGTPFDGFNGNEPARQGAESTVNAAVSQWRNVYFGVKWSTTKPEEAIWEPFFIARALAGYAQRPPNSGALSLAEAEANAAERFSYLAPYLKAA